MNQLSSIQELAEKLTNLALSENFNEIEPTLASALSEVVQRETEKLKAKLDPMECGHPKVLWDEGYYGTRFKGDTPQGPPILAHCRLCVLTQALDGQDEEYANLKALLREAAEACHISHGGDWDDNDIWERRPFDTCTDDRCKKFLAALK